MAVEIEYKEKSEIRIKIQCATERENLIVSLVNAGYEVSLIEKKIDDYYPKNKEFWVAIKGYFTGIEFNNKNKAK